eukprot:6177180-Pleurochrysis_carterae.AAC.6
MKRAFGRAKRLPLVPLAAIKAAIWAHIPMLTVWISYGIICIVSYIARPDFITPPPTFMYIDTGAVRSSFSRKRRTAMMVFAKSSSMS